MVKERKASPSLIQFTNKFDTSLFPSNHCRLNNVMHTCNKYICIQLHCTDIWGHVQPRRVHPKLRNINPHDITHSLISQNPRNRCSQFKFHSLFSHYSPLYHEFCFWCKSPKKSTYTLALCHVSICGVSPSYSSSYASCWMLVHAYATLSRKAKWSGPNQLRGEENEFEFHNVTCYTSSIVSFIHVSTTKLHTSSALWLPQVWYYGVKSVSIWFPNTYRGDTVKLHLYLRSLK